MKTPASNKVLDRLIESFILELDVYAHNGVLRGITEEEVQALISHYVRQCPEKYKPEFIAQLRVMMLARWNYSLLENLLMLSEACESGVKKGIIARAGELMKNSHKWATAVMNAGLINPLRIIKSYLEPAVANTLLTYSLVIQPPMAPLNLAEAQLENGSAKSCQPAHAETAVALDKFAGLSAVSEYTDNLPSAADIAWTTGEAFKQKKPVRMSRLTPIADKTSVSDQAPREWKLDYTRRIMEPVSPAAHVRRGRPDNADRYVMPTEQRPVNEIRAVMAKYEYKIANCFGKKNPTKEGPVYKVPVRFRIQPSGKIFDIQFLSGSISREIADRLMIQLRQIQFSKIDPRLGDQNVYHTFFY